MKNNSSKIAYWVTTGLVAAVMLMGGVMDLARPPQVLVEMGRLGYPAYFALILGAWKLLSVPALLAPGLPRLKEWAYAGIVFDLTGAAISHVAVGDAVGKIATPIILLALAVASYRLRPAARRVVVPAVAPAPRVAGEAVAA